MTSKKQKRHTCGLCGQLAEPGRMICEACAAEFTIAPSGEPVCELCERPVEPGRQICLACAAEFTSAQDKVEQPAAVQAAPLTALPHDVQGAAEGIIATPPAPPTPRAAHGTDLRAIDVLLVDEVEGAIYKLSGICITRSLALLSAATRADITTLLTAAYESRGYTIMRRESSTPQTAALEAEASHGWL